MSIAVTPNLVGGSFSAQSSGEPIDVLNPADGSVVGRVAAMGPAEVEAVIAHAVEGALIWRAVGAIERGRVLFEAASLIRAESAELARLIVAEMGKTLAEASGEVAKAAEFFEYYAGMGRSDDGTLVPDTRAHTFAMHVREPIGPVLLVTPWNDPLLTPARKLAPALIAGDSVVIKPATETPLVALRLAAILHRAGVPAGVLGTVTGRGSQIGDVLTGDPRLAGVSFTGSTAVGLALQRRLAGTGVRVQTEMGGKNAAVVLSDADLDLAVGVLVGGAFAQTGQRCTATSRLIVERSVAGQVRDLLATAITGLRVGPGIDAGTQIGPVVSLAARREILGRLDAGATEGAVVVATAPVPPTLSAEGAFVAPVLLSVEPGNSLWRDEIFGPVLSMIEVDSLEEAVAAVNASEYGLSSAIYTRSLDAAFRFVAEVETGQVSINQPTSGWDVHQPFGGFKQSGSAFKEQGVGALDFYTRVKTVAVRTR